MASFFRTFCQTGLPFGLVLGFFYLLMNGWRSGLTVGLVSGIAFGLMMAAFVKYQSIKFTKNRPLLPGENLLKEGGANYQAGGEAAGGWIYLTDSRLIYVSHKLNISNHEFSIPLSEIVSLERGRTLGIVPNQLKVNLRDGRTEKFVVQDVKSWISKLENIIRNS